MACCLYLVQQRWIHRKESGTSTEPEAEPDADATIADNDIETDCDSQWTTIATHP
jgi:hypothetical protein